MCGIIIKTTPTYCDGAGNTGKNVYLISYDIYKKQMFLGIIGKGEVEFWVDDNYICNIGENSYPEEICLFILTSKIELKTTKPFINLWLADIFVTAEELKKFRDDPKYNNRETETYIYENGRLIVKTTL